MKERYDFTCPACGHKQQARPSLGMREMSVNDSHIHCKKCGLFLHLRIAPDINGDRMEATDWDEYLKNRKE